MKDHKKISQSLANAQEVNQRNQNDKEDPNIMGSISLIIFGVIIILTFLPLILLQTESIHFLNPLQYYIIFIFPSIILPCLYFIVNRNCLPSVMNFFFWINELLQETLISKVTTSFSQINCLKTWGITLHIVWLLL